jgi:alkaline phosphatase D
MAALALAALGLPASDRSWAQLRLPVNPFALGVASGAPTHEGVVLWTRLYDPRQALPAQDLPVRWEVALSPDFGRVLQSGASLAVAGLAHAVHVEVSGLPANQWFHYRFRVGEHVSPVGTTRTFAAPGMPQQALRVGYASCQHFEHGYFSAYTHLALERPDLLVFLGDYIYEYAPGRNGIRAHTGGWCLDLPGYRERYAQYRLEPELQQMHAACPWLLTWDDHEVQNDYAGLQQGSAGPPADFAARRAAAYQAYYEHMPLPTRALMAALAGLQQGAELRLYARYRLGDLVNLCMLDTRQYRHPQVCTPGERSGSALIDPARCDALADPQRSLLGRAQEQWLEQQMADAQGPGWNLLAQSTLLGASITRTREGEKIWNDGWDGYPAARARLTGQLQRHRVPNVVMLGGDVHENWVGYIKRDYSDPGSESLGVELCGTSISSRNSRSTQARLQRNPHFIYAEGTRRGYGLLHISHEALVVHLRALIDPRDRHTGIETLARFRLASGCGQLVQL